MKSGKFKGVYLKRNVLIFGLFVCLLCISTIFIDKGIPLREVPPDEMKKFDETWPAFLPPPGLLFLLCLLLHFWLFTGTLSCWYHHPRSGKIFIALWILLWISIFYMAFRSFRLFPSMNPLYFNWRVKSLAFFAASVGALVLSNVFAKLLERKKQECLQHDREVRYGQYPILAQYPDLPEHEARFLTDLIDKINEHIANQGLDCKFLAGELCMSEQTLRRRLHKIMGLTPGKFIKSQRLIRAQAMDDLGTFSSYKELATAVGFKSTSYFMTLYRDFVKDTQAMNGD